MDKKLIEYHESIGQELEVVKNRVRNLLGETTHWPSEGRHKEAILKTVLDKHLPQSVSSSNGFIKFDNGCSNEIDIILYDNTKPLLFNSDNLIITTPSTVCGAIEVKTKLISTDLDSVIEKISKNSKSTIERDVFLPLKAQLEKQLKYTPKPWFSLFAFESSVSGEKVLESLKLHANGDVDKALKCVCLGPNRFIRFWNVVGDHSPYFTGWKLYDLPGLAYSYFISNLIWRDIGDVEETNHWFPLDNKETQAIASISLK